METSTYKILLENTQEGSASATVLELPDLQITAPTSQEAIAKIQDKLTRRLAKAEIVSIQVPAPTPQPRNPWIEFAGIFKDDPDFAAIAQEIRAERSDDNI
jgi:hypothetical protein